MPIPILLRKRGDPTAKKAPGPKPGVQYLVNDMFLDAQPPGRTSGIARPGGSPLFSQAWTGIDTNGTISQVNGVLNFATGAAANDGVWWASHPRLPGQAVLFKITPADLAGIDTVGYDISASGIIQDYLRLNTTIFQISANGGAGIAFGTVVSGITYYICAEMRATGFDWYIRGGTYTYWTLLLRTNVGTAAGFPAVQAQNATSVFTCGFMRTPQTRDLCNPCISDGFGGLVTVSDGLGHPEGLSTTSDLGKGGGGQSRLSPATWANAGGVTVCTPVGGTLDELVSPYLATQPDVWAEIKIPAFTAGRAGMMLNIDVPALPLNGLFCYHNGTQIILSKYVASAETALLTVADVYAANVKLIVHKIGTAIRVYKETAAGVITLVGAAATVASTNCYMSPYSNNAGNSLNDFAVTDNGSVSGAYEARFNPFIE